jgi:hypothetical protein
MIEQLNKRKHRWGDVTLFSTIDNNENKDDSQYVRILIKNEAEENVTNRLTKVYQSLIINNDVEYANSVINSTNRHTLSEKNYALFTLLYVTFLEKKQK